MYKNPVPTVDVIIRLLPSPHPLLNGETEREHVDFSEFPVVLIKRKNPPFGWALPGGFVDEGESLEFAALREAAEETGLSVQLDALLYVYSNPQRDERQHTISTVFLAHACGVPHAMDDAAEVKNYHLDSLPEQLAFDHGEILNDYVHFLRSGEIPAPYVKYRSQTAGEQTFL